MRKQAFHLEYPPGATPLDPNEIDGLLADYISTQGELNQLEQENILEAASWASGAARNSYRPILTESFVRELHKRMFKRVWRWAGKFRQSDKSIGVAWEQISTELAKLLADTDFWIKNGTYQWDELGARFHHRLVVIHPFSNGNGRHARLMTNLLLEAHQQAPFTWGANQSEQSLSESSSSARTEYVASLKEADARKYDRLIRFVRS